MCDEVSDHDPRGHAVSRHRQVRLAHTSTVGTPAIGRSRTSTRRRPFPTARTPQPEHHARSCVVSTASHNSPSRCRCAVTAKPSMPTSATALNPSSLPFPTSEASHLQISTIRRMTRPPARLVDPNQPAPNTHDPSDQRVEPHI
jgi:hypothetical protein